ncbi:hypothetical protein CALCODRAFT_510290 [Calocera cornea HHB12733]|uniref:Uncharacterized protein n=1 Tax=Calocera cornea HHB12733 TaxID=1353952 RepID=A0A165EM92_9BASI|nr:hypothetical protein CALCODRAFT_510290 [Calocera cornea HHB12733]
MSTSKMDSGRQDATHNSRIPKVLSFISTSQPALPCLRERSSWITVRDGWLASIKPDGTLLVVFYGAHLPWRPSSGTSMLVEVDCPIILDEGCSHRLCGTPQASHSNTGEVQLLVSWDIDRLTPRETASGAIPEAVHLGRKTYLFTISSSGSKVLYEIPHSSHPVAFAKEWACFSDKDGVAHAHVRNLKDGREADMMLDTFHGSLFGTFVLPSLSLFVFSDEYGGIRIFDIDTLSEHAQVPNSHAGVAPAKAGRTPAEAGYRTAQIPQGATVLHHPVAGIVLVLRRDEDLELYCQVQADGPGDPSAWATVKIPTSVYLTALCLSPEANALIMLLHDKVDKCSQLRMSLLPPRPAVHRRRIEESLDDWGSWDILHTTPGSDILRHCNSLQVLSTKPSGETTLLVGQLESTLWIEITCMSCDWDNRITPVLPTPSWMTMDDSGLLARTSSDVIETLRGRSAAGGVIRKTQSKEPLSLGAIAPSWVAPDMLPILEDDFYSRSTELAPLVGAAADMALAFGVSRPMQFLGGHSDGYHSYWLAATPTPKGNRYFAYAVVEDREADPDIKEPATFRYSDVQAAHALELVTRRIGERQFKKLHPDAPYIASALQEDIGCLTNTRAATPARIAAALRLS